jgi:hypothetical protein
MILKGKRQLAQVNVKLKHKTGMIRGHGPRLQILTVPCRHLL